MAFMLVDLEEGENDTKIAFKRVLCVCVRACVLDVTSLGYGAVRFTAE
jgi:hypothetical protein